MTRQRQTKRTSKVHLMRMLRVFVGVTSLMLCSCGGEDGAVQSSGTTADSGHDSGGSDASETNDASRVVDATRPLDMGNVTDLGRRMDLGPLTDAGGSDLGQDATSNAQERYAPDNGPTHENGSIVAVNSEAEILTALANASPGDVITVRPGAYTFSQLIRVQNSGRAAARIFFRAEELGSVTLNLSHIENFKIYGKFWVFENIRFVGDCADGRGCEHAFHIVGDADDLIFRNNEIVNFASHVKLNGEVVGDGVAKSFPDRTMFIGNFWHNTRYVTNNVPHNILNLDGGKDHVVRGNIFADYNTPESVPKSASAVYPKASTLRILIEQNLIVCEKSRRAGETARGIQLGDGAPASICDGDADGDGSGDCAENGQNQEAIVRNNIIMNCDNGGSSAGVLVGSDRGSKIYNNTVYNVGRRSAGFYVGHPDHETFWRSNILENGVNTRYAENALNEMNNITPSLDEMNSIFRSPADGDFALVEGADISEQGPTHDEVAHDFCGYPRGARSDLGAVEYSTAYPGMPCGAVIKEMYDRIP